MGVKTIITLKHINALSKKIGLKFVDIKNSISGISDSVYILKTTTNKKYVLKLYENSSLDKVLNEIEFLQKLNNLEVSRPLHIFEEYEKPLVLFSFLDGISPIKIEKEHLSQLASFLKRLHRIKIDDIDSNNEFELESLLKELESFEDLNSDIKDEFIKRFNLVKNIDLNKYTSIVHGDIFPDNTKFIDFKLNGVYDFSEVFVGNRYIDLAIVIDSWCFNNAFILNKKLANQFLNEYEEKLDLKFMGEYLLYVNLYFALKRFISLHKNLFIEEVCYKEYLKKFDNTLFLIGRKN